MARILLIDDCSASLLLLESRLALDGHDVMQTPSARQALTLVRSRPFDVIITDLFMPDLDGLEFLAALHAQGATIPIIAISANQLSLDMLSVARAIGATATLEKPVDFDALARAIDAAVNRCHDAVEPGREAN